MSLLARLFALLLAAAACIPAQAQENPGPTVWHARYPLAPNHPVVTMGWQVLAEALKPEIDLQLRLQGPRLGTAEALEAIARGQHQVGIVALASYPKSFPYWGLLSEMFLIGRDSLASAAAISELVLLECERCQDNLARQKLVFLGTYGAAGYGFIAPKPLTQPLSLKGETVGSPGSLWDRLVAQLGGKPVVLSSNPPASLAAGEITALIGIPSTLHHPALAGRDVVFTRASLGSYRGASPLTVNRNAWRELTVDQRRRVFDAAATAIVRITRQYLSEETAALAVADTRGAAVARSSLLLQDRIRRFATADFARVIQTAEARFGIGDAPAFAEKLQALYNKYATLAGPHVSDDAAIALLRTEIFDRLNAQTYGLD